MAKAKWNNRIISSGMEDPDQLLANPYNWRIHPKQQQEALKGVLKKVGWVQDIIVNKRTGHIVDGHLRVLLAMDQEEAEVPVKYIDISEKEELLILATFDPLGALAVTDEKVMAELIEQVKVEDVVIEDLLNSMVSAENMPAVGGMRSPIPWFGGKQKLIRRLLKLMPPHRTYVEPFCGGAGLLFAKEYSKVEVINDIHGELINFFQVVKDKWKKLLGGFKWMLHSRRWFKDMKKQDPSKLDPVQRAVRFFYLQKSSFGGKGVNFSTAYAGQNMADYLLRVEETIIAAHDRLRVVTIEELDFAECIQRYDRKEAFIYVDPPYKDIGKKHYRYGMEDQDFERLRDVLREVKGKWLMSHADETFIRELFEGFEIMGVITKYRTSPKKGKEMPRKEVLIANYPLE